MTIFCQDDYNLILQYFDLTEKVLVVHVASETLTVYKHQSEESACAMTETALDTKHMQTVCHCHFVVIMKSAVTIKAMNY